MARPKLTPMEFMRRFLKHEPGFAQPTEEHEVIPSTRVVIATETAQPKVKAKVA